MIIYTQTIAFRKLCIVFLLFGTGDQMTTKHSKGGVVRVMWHFNFRPLLISEQLKIRTSNLVHDECQLYVCKFPKGAWSRSHAIKSGNNVETIQDRITVTMELMKDE